MPIQPGPGFGVASGKFVPVALPDVSALRAVTIFSHLMRLRTAGAATEGDGFGKSWKYDELSDTVDDGTDYPQAVKPDSVPSGNKGRWIPMV
jgi:hypothetical protein